MPDGAVVEAAMIIDSMRLHHMAARVARLAVWYPEPDV